MIGTTVSHYKVIEKLGAGGMGEVFLAEDAKLDRKVALKFLPPGMASDPDVKARFMQEAKAASALNHPNVCTIHDIQEHEGQMYIVMEYVDGATLADKKNQLSVKKAVEIVAQVADGLAAAHEKGIVHRDIKAENIMLRSDGIAQVMDFGLAKLRGVSRLTKEGSTVGTTAYMSPEAIQGHDLDYRTDLYSLGVVLFELLTGRLPFDAVHETAVMYEIVNVDAPPPTALRSELDPELDRIVLECLDKDPEERYQSAKGLARDLRRFNRTSSGRMRASQVSRIKPAYQQPSGIASPPLPGAQQSAYEQAAHAPVPPGPPSKSSRIPWLVAAAAMAACVVLAVLYLDKSEPMRAVSRSLILAPDSTMFVPWGGGHLAMSPDGKRLAFVAADSSLNESRLWVRPISSMIAFPLPGTEGASYPFWSADSRHIAFFSQGKLRKIEASGGPPMTLCDATAGRAGTWNANDVIVFSPDQSGFLFRVPAAGGEPESVTVKDTTANDFTHRWAWFLPDDNHFLYFARTGSGSGSEMDAICVGSLDGRTYKRLVRAKSNAVYAAGHLLFVREGALMAQPFDADAVELTGDAFPIAEAVSYSGNFSRGSFTVSQTGTLVYQSGDIQMGSQLLLYDRTGQIRDTIGELDNYYSPALSPDGKRIAVDVDDPTNNNTDIWIYDMERGIRTRFTFDSTGETNPVWSPDGAWLAFRSSPGEGHGVYMKSTSGAGEDSLVWHSQSFVRTNRWSAEPPDIYALALLDTTEARPIVATSFGEWDPAPSPDGRWLAYTSEESGDEQVYVVPFEGGGGKWQVSINQGDRPRWRSDGKELYYLDNSDHIMVAQVDGSGSSFRIGKVSKLFEISGSRPGKVFDVSGDGQTFLVNSRTSDAILSKATLVTNWDAEIKER
jgi:serine/threonine protein kinase/Tol biopolymer transport system component